MNQKLKTFVFQILLATCIALAVFGYRLHMIHDHGLQFPINDQWYSEYNNLYKPYFEGRLRLGDFFTSNNEHVVAIQKAIHLALLVALGEWSPLAQMVLNAFLFSTLLFFFALLAGLYLGPLSSLFFQAAILACGLLPGPAENFLFGFQTGWYVYYFLSGLMLLCLSKSNKFDLWWLVAWVFAILSCLCLASGIGNLLICLIAPSLRDWSHRVLFKSLFVRSIPYVCLCLPVMFIFLKIAIEGRPTLPDTNRSLVLNLLDVFSYPIVLIPLTYLPTLTGFVLLIFRPSKLNQRTVCFPLLFAAWAFFHAAMISVGRGGFSGRHSELLIFGILANLLILLTLFSKFAESHRVCVRRFAAFWLATMFAGLAFQFVQGGNSSQNFSDFMLPRYEHVLEARVLNNYANLDNGSWETGLPAGLFAENPNLIDDPILQKNLKGFYPLTVHLEPSPNIELLMNSMKMFPTPFPFISWAKLEREQSLDFSARGIDTPYAKVAIAGRWENPATGIYSKDLGMQKLGLKMPFSQTDGWRAVFLPVRDGMVEFTARVAGDRDWIYIQQPIPVSRWQLGMEFVGRQAWRIWAISVGLSIFLLVLKCFLAAPFPATPKSEIS